MSILKVEVEKLDDVTVAHVIGEVDAVTCTKLEEALNGIVDAGDTTIILDLDHMTYISSAGLRVILSAARRLHGQGQLSLCCRSESVKEVLEMTGFTNIMELYNGLECAKSAVCDKM
jgi:anti-sigma B factor antagonist